MRKPLLILAAMCLTACTTLREGVVVSCHMRGGMPSVYGFETSFRYEPSIYWVRIEGHDLKGRLRHKDILLFRHDWDMLRVGDHWSRRDGFSPGLPSPK